MDIELIVDKNLEKEKVIIYAKNNSPEISEIINKISKIDTSNIIGYIDNEVFILDRQEIWSFYSEENKVFAKVKEKIYRVKYRIYELEELLEGTSFIRISNSEIVNINKIQSLDLGYSGTVVFKFKDGSTTYASRRSINKIKKYLNL